ncbi:zinc finger HIT domain-containing protein 3 [Nephila pilipes]|uniref:Zinc finger HIT domain-containing protein 3 n=1 Tax=Nephila pilipes TaxID=299642 RepID=A0A8X6QJ80_NEPPI|nr:zinc finger HIT domain-containing protein 3 [Nephila pilipes]
MTLDGERDLDVNISRISECEVCKVNNWIYKCPACLIKFCSVPCYKTHKAGDSCVNPEPVVEIKSEANVYEYETEDTVNPEKLKLLDSDNDVRQDLENPHLRQFLARLNSSKNPSKDIEDAMKEPIFSEFSRRCLAVVSEEQN